MQNKQNPSKVVQLPYAVFEALTNFLDSSGLPWSKLNPVMQLLSQTHEIRELEAPKAAEPAKEPLKAVDAPKEERAEAKND